MSLNLASADLSPGLTSGWCLRASLPIGLLDFLFGGRFRDAERRVVVLEVHGADPEYVRATYTGKAC